MKRPITLVLVAFAALSITAEAPSPASQYPLDQVAVIIPRPDAKRLRKAGVKTTADFLVWGRTPEGRSLLAARARLPIESVAAWCMLADLMRVRGIGPDVARLLTAVGVRTLADLQRSDAEPTAAAIKEMNKKAKLSTNPPGAESIGYWVEQSRKLPIVLVP